MDWPAGCSPFSFVSSGRGARQVKARFLARGEKWYPAHSLLCPNALGCVFKPGWYAPCFWAAPLSHHRPALSSADRPGAAVRGFTGASVAHSLGASPVGNPSE
jgi:hypothetical protein